MAQAKISDTIPDEDCLRIEDLAEEFGLKVQRTRQLVEKAIKEKVVPNWTKTKGRAILYTPDMVKGLLKAKEEGRLGKFNKSRVSKRNLKNAEIIIQVPIYDTDVVFLLKQKYGDEAGMSKHLQNMLENTVKPIMAKKQELKEKYERELQALLRSSEAIL